MLPTGGSYDAAGNSAFEAPKVYQRLQGLSLGGLDANSNAASQSVQTALARGVSSYITSLSVSEVGADRYGVHELVV